MKNCIYILLLFLLFACSKNKQVVSVSDNVNPSEQVLQEKYANILTVPPSQISNLNLYSFIDDWIGVKYKYGGMSKEGVDCSGFCNILYSSVFKQELPRTTSEISRKINVVNKDKLQEGNIVVFNIGSKKNSHVGVYLKNNKFVHASTSKGVLVSSLDNPYYVKAYSKGGEVK